LRFAPRLEEAMSKSKSILTHAALLAGLGLAVSGCYAYAPSPRPYAYYAEPYPYPHFYPQFGIKFRIGDRDREHARFFVDRDHDRGFRGHDFHRH